LFIELVPAGELTPLLHALPVGAYISLRKAAKGRFTLDVKSGHKNHLLLSTVTGIAPYISYMRTLYKDWGDNRFPNDIHLYLINAASRSWEFGYHDELEQLASKVPWLTYIPTVSRPYEDTQWRGEIGRVEDLIRKYKDQWKLAGSDTTGYLCGNPQMIELGKGILFRCGFAKESLKEEVYWIPPKTLRR
jgi:ferredoxin--NADP+ reductase